MEKEQTSERKDHILKAFQQLLADRKPVASTIATKQEIAERAEDQQVVVKASAYSVETIIKGLAELQLNFGSAVAQLIKQLAVESPKLGELRRAIRVETKHVEELRHIKIAADALDMLIQEHQESMNAFETASQQERQMLDQEIAEIRQAWQKEQKEFETAVKERQKSLKKEREQREADEQYESDRQRKLATDDYAARKTALERQIAEEDVKREADWGRRERVLTEQQESVEKYRVLVESFPQELEEAVRRVREEAVKEVQDEAKLQAELLEKGIAANKEVYELKIASLQETIGQHARQIEQVSGQLQAAVRQAQELAVKAVEGSRKAERSV